MIRTKRKPNPNLLSENNGKDSGKHHDRQFSDVRVHDNLLAVPDLFAHDDRLGPPMERVLSGKSVHPVRSGAETTTLVTPTDGAAQRALRGTISSECPIQRVLKVGDVEHKVRTKYYKKIRLITELKDELEEQDTELGGGWKQYVWTLAKEDQPEQSFDDLEDLIKHLEEKFPPPSGSKPKEDVEMRELIDAHAKGLGKKADRQATGLHHLATEGTKEERAKMLKFLEEKRNRAGIVANTRMGGLNETLLTKDTPELIERSLGKFPGVQSTAKTKSGETVSWIRMQEATSLPTRMFHFGHTTTGEGGEYQDTHPTGHMYRFDSDGERHLTVGDTSPDYHLGKKKSLEANLKQSHHLRSHQFRNYKLHQHHLATRDKILGVKASQRADQIYKTSSGKELHLNREADLEEYADNAEVHRRKALSQQKRKALELEATSSESESEPDWDDDASIASDAETEVEVEKMRKERSKKKDKKDKKDAPEPKKKRRKKD